MVLVSIGLHCNDETRSCAKLLLQLLLPQYQAEGSGHSKVASIVVVVSHRVSVFRLFTKDLSQGEVSLRDRDRV